MNGASSGNTGTTYDYMIESTGVNEDSIRYLIDWGDKNLLYNQPGNILGAHAENPKKIIIAAPVAGHRVAKEIDALVDEIIILTTPRDFQAAAQVYENWYDVPDEEVIAIMDQWMAQRVRT